MRPFLLRADRLWEDCYSEARLDALPFKKRASTHMNPADHGDSTYNGSQQEWNPSAPC
jgi:hypothetical protein